jgi:hypothetical protein
MYSNSLLSSGLNFSVNYASFLFLQEQQNSLLHLVMGTMHTNVKDLDPN